MIQAGLKWLIIFAALMKKSLLICFTLVALLSVALENYRNFFKPAAQIEFADKNDNSGNDSGKAIEKEGFTDKEKYLDTEVLSCACLLAKNKFYIIHSISVPAPYTSLPEMPPEQA